MKPDSTMDGLYLDEISIRLAGRTLLCLSATVRPSDILTVMCPSGSGKSAMLADLGGFLDPVFTGSGRIVIDGRDITAVAAEKRQAGMLLQDPLLFPYLSVGGNLLSAGLPIILVTHDRTDAEAAGGKLATIGEETNR